MFTGIIENTGRIESTRPGSNSVEISIDLNGLEKGTKIGDSIAVNGVCLTVTKLEGSLATFDAVKETISRTNLSELSTGNIVNLERALQVGDRLGGHFVQGHVDTIGTVQKIVDLGKHSEFYFSIENDFCNSIIEKGSVAVNGISLTVVKVENSHFSIAVIPHTLKSTTLGQMKPGDKVNLEGDLIGKWVKKLLGQTHKKDLAIEDLISKGF